jgi:EAL domain-containing protein (putative c-di-GMP-specific phosphodiesterase class I)
MGNDTEISAGQVLVVDDDDAIRAAVARCLERAGFRVVQAAAPSEAIKAIVGQGFDAVVSDITMPEFDGIELLRRVRSHDLDLPVVLLTGAPSLDTAVSALEHGAFRYLTKPVDWELLARTVRQAADMHALARLRRQLLALAPEGALQVGDRSGLEARFDAGLERLYLVFQPIVSFGARRVFAYEALMRSEEPSLPHPGALLDAAERLGRLRDLSRAVRKLAHRACTELPDGVLLFVNLHPQDLDDEQLVAEDMGRAAAGRIVYEITERARLEQVKSPRAQVERLRELGYRVAIDDIGAGYAGLNTVAQLEPEVLKLDMELVRGIHESALRQNLVGSMVELCRRMGMQVIAEGVETEEERDTLVALGCDLLQGFLFARPNRELTQPFG